MILLFLIKVVRQEDGKMGERGQSRQMRHRLRKIEMESKGDRTAPALLLACVLRSLRSRPQLAQGRVTESDAKGGRRKRRRMGGEAERRDDRKGERRDEGEASV